MLECFDAVQVDQESGIFILLPQTHLEGGWKSHYPPSKALAPQYTTF